MVKFRNGYVIQVKIKESSLGQVFLALYDFLTVQNQICQTIYQTILCAIVCVHSFMHFQTITKCIKTYKTETQ